MSEFTEAQLEKVALLARLKLTPAELAELSQKLGQILRYVEQLQSVPTEGVEPMAHPLNLQNIFRPDEKGREFPAETALANAPKRLGDFFAVPAVLGDSDGSAA